MAVANESRDHSVTNTRVWPLAFLFTTKALQGYVTANGLLGTL